jgi:small conductance mechanosensitive channel
MAGIVEDMGLRITRIRDLNGDLHIIPNGEIIKVTNHTRGVGTALFDISVAYEEDLDRVYTELNNILIKAYEELEDLITIPEILGVTELGESGVAIRLSGRTTAGKRWEIERKLRKIIKDGFDRKGIEIPYNRVVVIKSEEKKS